MMRPFDTIVALIRAEAQASARTEWRVVAENVAVALMVLGILLAGQVALLAMGAGQ